MGQRQDVPDQFHHHAFDSNETVKQIWINSCDFVLTPDDELIFLEANITGNWLWLENEDSHPILDEIVRLLSCKLR